MQTLIRYLVCFSIIGLCTQVFAIERNRLSVAQHCFEYHTELADNFDPSVADLYSDKAYIENTRIYPNGQNKKIVLPATHYKILIKSVMPLAKARGDRNTYSDLQYAVEGTRVRINGMRYSVLKHYESPVSLLMGVDGEEECVLFEEITQSRP